MRSQVLYWAALRSVSSISCKVWEYFGRIVIAAMHNAHTALHGAANITQHQVEHYVLNESYIQSQEYKMHILVLCRR